LLIQTIAVARSQSQKALGVGFMWIEKLLGGVLRVLTPLGARYIRPALAQRIYLLWIFRNFKVLPLQVL